MEFGSLLDIQLPQLDLRADIRRTIADFETLRGRPLLVYVANVTTPATAVSIGPLDEVPVSEMIDAAPNPVGAVDVMVATPGGSAASVSRFVDKLRSKFDRVEFFIPNQCMSAGTIWALSGEQIWMDERGYLGPIDPQVLSKDGRYLPAQALLVLLEEIRKRGQEAINRKESPAWTDIRLIDNMNAKEVGDVYSLSKYSIDLAADYLCKYKFRDWTTRSSGAVLTDEHKATRAREIAERLCSHESWRSHAHGISRDVLAHTVRLKINHPEDVNGLLRLIRRIWALFQWAFDNTAIQKVYISSQYSLFRQAIQTGRI